MSGGRCAKLLVGAAALLLLANMYFSRPAAYTSSAQVSGGTAASAASREAMLRASSAGSVPQAQQQSAGLPRQQQQSPAPQQHVPPQLAAASASELIAVHMPPPPPSVEAEEVPLAERVVVPPGETLPPRLAAMRKGTDLYVSFASSSMAPFALNRVRMIDTAISPRMASTCETGRVCVAAFIKTSVVVKQATAPTIAIMPLRLAAARWFKARANCLRRAACQPPVTLI